MATSTTTPIEGIAGKTTRHSIGIHNARMDGLKAILSRDLDALTKAWNDLNEHAEELITLEAAQRRYLEAYCRNMEAKGEARSKKVRL